MNYREYTRAQRVKSNSIVEQENASTEMLLDNTHNIVSMLVLKSREPMPKSSIDNGNSRF